MANQGDMLLRDMIQSVQQRPQFDAMGNETQVVVVSFITPSGFTGTTTLPLSQWKDPRQRFDHVAGAVKDLEGPFWDMSEAVEERG